ncbi:MAG: helix-turn-helix domain-containing protein [Atopobiaceae bacterium]|nr:helix-turn-helix domain-containing protein [Atopobiaceae bacterium]
MNASELPRALLSTTDYGHLHPNAVREHFAKRYPLVDYRGRDLFLFGQAREFGDARHIVSFHGKNSPVTPEHIFSYVIITYCWQGSFSMELDREPVTLQAGDCVVMDRHVPHGVMETGLDDITVNLILADEFFEGRLLDGMADLASPFATELMTPGASHDHYRVYRTAHDEMARACVERVLCEHLEPDMTSPYLIDFFLAALLTHLLRTYEPKGVLDDVAYERAELMGAVREYIALNYREGNLAQAARDLGYERTYLSKFVRQASGMTFKQLVNVERMRRAALLLRGSNRPIYEIAEDVGLSNLTSFYQRFREWSGCTPQEYRKQG